MIFVSDHAKRTADANQLKLSYVHAADLICPIQFVLTYSYCNLLCLVSVSAWQT